MSTVLVIDGDESIRTTLARILLTTGYSVVTSGTPQETLLHLAAQKVNLILMDTNLPDQQGIRLLMKIRRLYPEVPIVVLASVYNTEWAEKAAASGVSEYYHKPMDPGLILFLVEEYLQKGMEQAEIATPVDLAGLPL